MNIDKQIADKIEEVKQRAVQETQDIIESSFGKTNTISSTQVRNMRMNILRDFQTLNINLLLSIKEDIQTGVNGDTNELVLKLNHLNEELMYAKREKEFIIERWREISGIMEEIKIGR